MIAAILLAAAPVASATDADLAFARDAKRIGQWSAFRKWADHDAVMFTPRPVFAHNFLKSLKDPPKSISWRPAQSFVSCDGHTAVNTGPWFTQDSKLAGYFTTVWKRTASGWRWVYDGGIPAALAGADRPKVRRASCEPNASGPPVDRPERPVHPSAASPGDDGGGISPDRTLGWDWKISRAGERTLRVFLWSGHHYVQVIHALDPGPKRR